MRERIDGPFALDEMARIAYLSPFYFNRVFRQLTGVPPRRFHMALRMAAAKRLLLTTELLRDRDLHGDRAIRASARSPRTSAIWWACRRARCGGWPPSRGSSAPNGGHAACTAAEAPAAPTVTGRLIGADDDCVVFVGLFDHACPLGMPVACTSCLGVGTLRAADGGGGCFHVAAVASRHPVTSAAACFPTMPASWSDWGARPCRSDRAASRRATCACGPGATRTRRSCSRCPSAHGDLHRHSHARDLHGVLRV